MKRLVWFTLLVAISGCVLDNDETTEPSPEQQELALRRCSRGQTRCSGNGVQTCGANGRWSAAVACVNACVNGACVGVCTPGSLRCSGNGVQTCGATGTFGTAVACANQTCVNGACAGVCAPGSTQCSGNSVQTCTTTGTFGAPVACVNQCLNGLCIN